MRHSTIKLTADLYGELGMEDVAEEVWILPSLFPPDYNTLNNQLQPSAGGSAENDETEVA